MATSVIYRLFTRGRRREVHHFHGDVFLTSGGGGVGDSDYGNGNCG